MSTHGKMAGVRLSDLELLEAWETTLRVVGFFSSAAAIHTYEDTTMPLGTNVLVTPRPETMESVLG